MPSTAAVQTSGFAWICPAGTRRLIQLRLHGNFGTARDGREALFAAQLSNAVIRVQGTKGDSHPQNHCHQSNQFSAHTLLLFPSMDAPRGRVLWEPPALEGTEAQFEKFREFIGEGM